MSANCSICGVPVPDGQSGICSVCYGDPEWGTDGYMRASMRHGAELAAEMDREAEARALEIAEASMYDPAV